MGAGASGVINEETERPLDASDIRDGDWKAAKLEVTRMRELLAQFNSQKLEAELSLGQSRTNLHRSVTAPAVAHADFTANETSEYYGRIDTSQEQRRHVQRAASTGCSPERLETRDGTELSSTNESREGRALWSRADIFPRDVHSQRLLDQVRTKLYERYDSLRASFLKFDVDRSGYISEDEFRLCMGDLGYSMSDDEYDLLQASYPHKEAIGERDRGIGYLEFAHIMTDELLYIPGSGEDGEDRYAGNNGHDTFRGERSNLGNIHAAFSRQVFGLFTNMKEAFKKADRDRSGFLELDEFLILLRNTLGIDAHEEDAEEILALFDSNGDRKLAYSEFVKCLQAQSVY